MREDKVAGMGRRRPAVRARKGMANASTIPSHPVSLSGEGFSNADTERPLAEERKTDMRTHRDAKAMAEAMREALAENGLDIPHQQALEIVARQFGLANWNILSAKIESEEAGASPEAIAFQQAVPIVRIFDVAKAHEFYLGFLGFSVDWEHRFHPNAPLYTQVSRGDLRLHLSEHAGDATPGGNMVVYMKGIRAFHAELLAKNYRYMRPGLEKQEWGLEVTVIDPFNNHIRFME